MYLFLFVAYLFSLMRMHRAEDQAAVCLSQVRDTKEVSLKLSLLGKALHALRRDQDQLEITYNVAAPAIAAFLQSKADARAAAAPAAGGKGGAKAAPPPKKPAAGGKDAPTEAEPALSAEQEAVVQQMRERYAVILFLCSDRVCQIVFVRCSVRISLTDSSVLQNPAVWRDCEDGVAVPPRGVRARGQSACTHRPLGPDLRLRAAYVAGNDPHLLPFIAPHIFSPFLFVMACVCISCVDMGDHRRKCMRCMRRRLWPSS